MKATPFNSDSDFAPIPFRDKIFRKAKQLKEDGLSEISDQTLKFQMRDNA